MPTTARLIPWLLMTLALAGAYVLLGVLAVKLALPPSYASLLYPGAGLALAAVLCLGPRAAPSVALGAFAVNVLLSEDRGHFSLLSPALIGLGAMLQALAGAWAVRRWVSQPLLLSEPADLLRFYLLGALLACTINPTLSSGALLLVGALDPQMLPQHWLSWWVGDTLGVLIGAPIALTLLAQPREAWAPRRLSVGLPLLATSLLLALVTLRIAEWDEQRERANFEHEADSAFSALRAELHEPLDALEAVRGILSVAPQLSRSEFEQATRGYLLLDGPVLALGWAAQLERQRTPAFEAAARAEGLYGYAVHDRGRQGDLSTEPAEPWMAIRLIEPLARNAPALGVNIRSIAASRHAVLQAARSGLPAATAGFQLSQDSEASVGVVVYQALYDGKPGTAAERLPALRGLAFATLRPDHLLKRVAAGMPARLEICLIDTDTSAPHRRLAGPPGCESLPTSLPFKLHALNFAGRSWDVRVYAREGLLPGGSRSSSLFALIGLFSTALLGALLLTVTGRARRVEALVQARTAELRHEVQERELASQAQAKSEQRLRNIFEHVPIGLLFADLDGRPREVNPHLCRMLGYSAEEMMEMRIGALTHPDDRAEDGRLLNELMAGHIGMYRRQKRLLARDGRVLSVRLLVTALRDSSGQPDRLLAVAEDITDQLKIRELEQARAAAEAASQAKNDFLSRMSHELRTPLNAMLGFTQLLDMDTQPALSARQRSWTAQVQHAGWHLLEMINDILDLSRIESGALKLELSRQDLLPLVDSAMSMVEKLAQQRGLRVSRSLGEGARYAWGDATRVRQVLTNLLSNAVKYNVEGGKIHISSRRLDERTLEIAVTDTGLGLSQEQQAQLFQPFNRLGRESSSTEGTGIGLVISKRLAELMGGSLDVASAPDEGACFMLRLPLADAPAQPSAEVARATPAPAVAGRAQRVIYVEDNSTNIEVMRGILAQRPQLQLEVHLDGASGLAALLDAPPELLLLDMQLPDMDGLTLLARLRADPRGATIPVVAVSANALHEQIERAQAAGVRHYLTKPVDVTRLLAVLDELLGGQNTAAAS